MAERATPDIKGFKKTFKIIKGKNNFPRLLLYSTPYSEAFYWRYKWANKFCKNKYVLEVPCGMGWGTSLLKSAKRIFGLDISEEAIREAITRYKNNKIDFIVGSMEKLDFQDQQFDTVVCLEGIEHVDKQIGKSFITESHRVLKKDGLLLVSSPRHTTKEHSGNPFHIYEYRLHELIELLSGYFIVNSIVRRSVDDLNVYYIVAQRVGK